MPDPAPLAPQPATPSAAPPVAAPAKPPLPAKPAAPPAKKGEDRRNFIVRFITSPVAIAWAAFTATMAAWTLGSTRFLYPNVLSEPPSKIRVGPPVNFEEGKVTDAFKDRNIWVVRYQGKIYALSTTCTHLGCT